MGWGWVLPEGSARCLHRLALSPAVKRPEDVCGPTKFRCVSTNTCIPASFHCDEESDCPDRSDEFGCSERGAGGELWARGPSPRPSHPGPSSSPLGASHPSLLLASSPSASPGGDPSPGADPGFPGPDGDLHLRGHRRPHPYHQLETQLGPHPLTSQVWLWSWQRAGAGGEVRPAGPAQPLPLVSGVPTRVMVTSEGGRSTLTIHGVKEADQGAYTCEAMNARGMVFGIPDGVLELIPQRGTAQQGRRAPGAGREPGLSARDRL